MIAPALPTVELLARLRSGEYLPSLRMDVEFVHRGNGLVRIHDPEQRRWVEFSELEVLVAQHMDGQQTFDTLLNVARMHQPGMTDADLEQLICRFHALGLLDQPTIVQPFGQVIPFPKAQAALPDGMSEFSVLRRDLFDEFDGPDAPHWISEDDEPVHGLAEPAPAPLPVRPSAPMIAPRASQPLMIPQLPVMGQMPVTGQMPVPVQAEVQRPSGPIITTPEVVAAEQEEVYRGARTKRWWQRSSLRVLAVLAILITASAFVPWTLHVTSDCTIIPNERSYVRSPIEGVIAEVLVDEGTKVKKGDVLVRLDDRRLVADREKAVAEIAKLEADLDRLKRGARKEEIEQQRAVAAARDSDVHFASVEVNRRSKMYSEGVGSKQALAEAQHDLETKEMARAEAYAALRLLEAGTRPEAIEAAEAQLDRAKAELLYIDQQLKDMVVITAPIDGVVLTPHFRERLHEKVEAGGLVCEIANIATVSAEIYVPEREADSLRLGLPVTVKVEAYPTHPFDGKVDFIAPSVEKTDKGEAVRVIVKLDNHDGMLKEDMHGYGEIDCGKRSVLNLLTRRLLRWIRVRFLL